jgi:hypothetical protein
MFLRKVEGRRAVTLPDGRVFSRSDLPPVTTERWVASRKVAVVRGVAYGVVTREEVLERYGLSAEEFDGWVKAIAQGGPKALRATVRHALDNLSENI